MYRLPFSPPRGVLTLLVLATLGTLVVSAQQGENAQLPVRQPAPDKDAVAKEKILNKMFKEELAKAKTDPQAARELSELLLREAKQTNEDSPLRYIALIYARDLAAQAGDTSGALAAIEELAKHYTVDTLAMK